MQMHYSCLGELHSYCYVVSVALDNILLPALNEHKHTLTQKRNCKSKKKYMPTLSTKSADDSDSYVSLINIQHLRYDYN